MTNFVFKINKNNNNNTIDSMGDTYLLLPILFCSIFILNDYQEKSYDTLDFF